MFSVNFVQSDWDQNRTQYSKQESAFESYVAKVTSVLGDIAASTSIFLSSSVFIFKITTESKICVSIVAQFEPLSLGTFGRKLIWEQSTQHALVKKKTDRLQAGLRVSLQGTTGVYWLRTWSARAAAWLDLAFTVSSRFTWVRRNRRSPLRTTICLVLFCAQCVGLNTC